jgi:hypothetical protein
MLRKRLAISAAVAPLLLMAWAAHAETTISTATTTPVATATANNGAADSITISSSGSVKRSDAGAAVTQNSNNAISNAGAITTTTVDNTTGILLQGGFSGAVTNTGSIVLNEDYTAKDTNNDGIVDEAYAKGTTRYGILSSGAHTGAIVNSSTGAITINGNNSAGILLGGPLTGAFENSGAISVTGDNGYGIRLQDVTGAVRIQGTVSTLGKKTTGVALDGNVTGAVVFEGTVGTTAYRYSTRPSLEATRAKILAVNGVDHPTGSAAFDPSLLPGSAVRIAGSVTGGVLFDVQPTLSTTNTDVNGNGILDANETSSTISMAGGAPAVLVGSDTQAITLGAVGTGDAAYGLISRGAVAATGVYDGVNATAFQLGGGTGKSTILTGGATFGGTIAASAFEANATAVHVTAGTQANTLQFTGTMSAVAISSGLTPATVGVDGNNAATAVLIDAGATVNTVRNTGTVSLAGHGTNADTVFVRDLSGSVTLVENSGKQTSSIIATTAEDFASAPASTASTTLKGQAIAVDVQAAASGVTVRQLAPTTHISTDTTDANGNGVYDADEPTMAGAILFGAHDDHLEILSGTYNGDVSFGAGANALVVDGQASVEGKLTATNGTLDVQVLKGKLVIDNADTLTGSNLTVSNASTIIFTADPSDPANNHATRLEVGTATLGAGTRIGLRLTDLLAGPTTYTVIHAGTLNASTLNEDILGSSPYLYVTHAGIDAANNSVFVDITRRTAAQIGMNKAQAAAFDPFYTALSQDTAIRDAFLAQTTQAGFNNLYNQMLPNTGAGLFSALEQAGQSITDAIATRPDPHQRYGPDSFWIQEINSRIQRNSDDTEGSSTQAFGFVGGYESMGDGGALGVTLSYVSAQERGSSAQVGEQTSATQFSLGAYWRGYSGPLTFNLWGGAGYVGFDSDRRLISGIDTNNDGIIDATGLNRAAHSSWNGFNASGGGRVAYEARFGRYFARPSAGMDFLYLNEGAHGESGGGNAFDLNYDKRSSGKLVADLMVSFGAEFGRDSWWRPELRLGYRQRLAGKLGDTITHYNGGVSFTTSGGDASSGAVVLGFSLKAGTPMSYLALEGDSETSSEEIRYLLRLVGRVMF